MKIDVFNHFAPSKYYEALKKATAGSSYLMLALEVTPAIRDIEARLRIVENHEDYVQILTLAGPPLDAVVSPQAGEDLAKLANDEMAELIAKYPDRIVGAAATIPMHNMDAALKELERAIEHLGLRAVQMHSSAMDKPLGSEEFFPLFEMINRYNLPILIHPVRHRTHPDYPGQAHSRYWVYQVLGWPYESSVAMLYLIFSGLFDRYPDLKFIIHHCGAMIPFLRERVIGSYDYAEAFYKTKYKRRLRKPLDDYLKMFYGDTAIHGYVPGLMCGYALFGAEHILFGTDMPHDSQGGERYIRQTIAGVEKMDISEEERELIFENNARRLFRLPV